MIMYDSKMEFWVMQDGFTQNWSDGFAWWAGGLLCGKVNHR